VNVATSEEELDGEGVKSRPVSMGAYILISKARPRHPVYCAFLLLLGSAITQIAFYIVEEL
jgi:hypothetical protein